MSYKAEVIADTRLQWVSNGLRFATEWEALAYGNDLYARWASVQCVRVVTADDAVNAEWRNGRLIYSED
jgi:hypothetical protein